MRLRIGLLFVLVLSSVVLAGCAGSQSGTTTTASTTASTTTETTATATTSDEPETGDNLLSVSQAEDSTAMKVNESKRANFSDLDEDQRVVFRKAHNCSCNVQQDVFVFNDKDRIEYVKYDGQWYFVRVSAV
ncbi:hypothetical protein [Halorussus halophilus]|uniref:hypothetical protein n=1 Tax=Halorussus halophilus TaxID=2650975 RepID=UPI001300DF06|nr:hypothetical protein [Halorussus halophilus]